MCTARSYTSKETMHTNNRNIYTYTIHMITTKLSYNNWTELELTQQNTKNNLTSFIYTSIMSQIENGCIIFWIIRSWETTMDS